MKDKESKKKLHESKIGKIIYGFLLFMPLFAIGVTCGYAIFNKNAKDSYSQYQTVESVQITNYTNLEIGSEYNINYQNQTAIQSPRFKYTNVSINPNEIFNDNLEYYAFAFLENNALRFYYQDGYKNTENNYWKNLKNLVFTYNGIENEGRWTIENQYVIYSRYLINGTLDNIFYYSVYKVTQSNLFNWVTTSNIYTGMSNFTTAMSVTNTFIPMLLTYWLIISVIYFLYDMVLVLLTVLHRKIHNLQDSI